MKLLFLIGNAAVGKMTVGQELMKRCDLRLFHNHMIIEPVLETFGYFHSEAIRRMRRVLFEEFARTDAYGMIFTYMWAFDQPSDWAYIEQVKEIAPGLKLGGILITKVDTRKNYFKQTLETLKELDDVKVFDTYIRVDSGIEWSQDNNAPVIAYKKSSRSAKEYMTLAQEIDTCMRN